MNTSKIVCQKLVYQCRKHPVSAYVKILFTICLTGIHSRQGCTSTTRHSGTRKEEEKDEKHIGKLIRKIPVIKSIN